MADLRQDEASLWGVRRILKDWITDASSTLRKKSVTDDNIHEARKQLKKSRAALRLLRDAIGVTAYRRENAALRDAACPLGAARDSKVLIATLDGLIERYELDPRSLQLLQFRRVLHRQQTIARRAITKTLINEQRKALRAVRARSDRWRMKGREWQVVGGGLERGYRSGRRKMATAAQSRANEDLHDWRKQVKYLWHQVQILRPSWPSVLTELARQTHKLSEHLGDDHDLAVLREKITANMDALDTQDRDALIAVLDRRRKQLQDQALKLGARLYEEKPRRFSTRIGRYWQLWRAEQD